MDSRRLREEREKIRWRKQDTEKETARQRVTARGSERGLNGFQTGCTAKWSCVVKECEM